MRKVFLIGLVMVGLLFSTTIALANHSWGSYHWGRTSPFTLQIEEDMTTQWDSILGEVSTKWTKSTVLDTEIVNKVKDAASSCKAILGMIRACNAKYGFNGWLGLAQIWIYSDGHIAQGTAKVNDTYFNASTYNNANAKQHVLCQEVGHDLGLDHQTAVSCMDDRNGLFDPAYNSPNAHDYEQLEVIYAHNDTRVTVKTSSASSANGEGANGHDFGVAVGKDSKGRPNQFVKDLGNGNKVYTFVTWAD